MARSSRWFDILSPRRVFLTMCSSSDPRRPPCSEWAMMGSSSWFRRDMTQFYRGQRQHGMISQSAVVRPRFANSPSSVSLSVSAHSADRNSAYAPHRTISITSAHCDLWICHFDKTVLLVVTKANRELKHTPFGEWTLAGWGCFKKEVSNIAQLRTVKGCANIWKPALKY